MLFIFSKFHGGGVERVLLTLSKVLNEMDFEIHVIIVDQFIKDFKIPKYIKIHTLIKNNSIFRIINSIPIMRFAYKLSQAVKLKRKMHYLSKTRGCFDLILRYSSAPMPTFLCKKILRYNNIFTWVHMDESIQRTSFLDVFYM